MSIFWPSKAQKEKARREREKLVDETARATSLATRAMIMQTLRDFTGYISKKTAEWQTNAEMHVRQIAHNWFMSKRDSMRARLAEGFNARIAEMNSQNLAGLLGKHADVYRQNLIKGIGQQTAELFHKQTSQRLADVLLALRSEMDTRRGPVASGNEALPFGTRFFFQKSNGHRLYIVEQPPMVRTIRFGTRGRLDSYRNYQLAFPFVVFGVYMSPEGCSALYVFFRSAPLTNLSDEIFVPALPNLERDSQGVCFAPPPSSGESPAQHVREVIDVFWGSGFNLDWSTHFARYQQNIPELATLEEWQKLSKTNPQFILSIPWVGTKLYRTIGEFAQTMTTERGESLGLMTIESAEQKVAAVAERVSKDAMEAALRMIPKLSIENAAQDAVVAVLQKTLRDSTGDIDLCLKEALEALAVGEPVFDDAFASARTFRDTVMLEADRRVGWTGLNVEPRIAAAA